jgi:shikimate kinase
MATFLLCGFMGSGKTTLMEKLSNEAVTIDLDAFIVEKLQIKGFNSIGEFVEEEDWEEFRYIEADNLSLLLDQYDDAVSDVVISLGGGAVNDMTLTIIEDSKAKLVWLDVPFETCWERIKDDPKRPLVLTGEEACHDLYRDRLRNYKRAEIKVDPESVKELQDIKSLIS